MESYTCFDNNNGRLYHNKKTGWYTENGKPTEVDFKEQTLSVVCDLEGNQVKFIKKDSGFIPLKIAYIEDLLSTHQQPDNQSFVTGHTVPPKCADQGNKGKKKQQSITKNEDFKSDGNTVSLKWADQGKKGEKKSCQIPANIFAIMHATDTFEKNGSLVLLSQNLKKALEDLE